jgi:hypothetical protein
MQYWTQMENQYTAGGWGIVHKHPIQQTYYY